MRQDDAATRDLLAWRARRETRRLAAARRPSSRAEPGREEREALDERLRDVLHRDNVSRARRAAQEAPAGAAGEPARSALRLLAEPYLENVAREETLDLARSEREREPDEGFRRAIVRQEDPFERHRTRVAWERAEAALAARRQVRRAAQDAAARDVGAPSRAGLVALTSPVPPDAISAAAARAAIEPLDAAIGAAALARRGRFRPPLPAVADPSDGVLEAVLADHSGVIDARGIARRLRTVARALDLDPDGRGPVLLEGLRGIDAATAFESIAPRPGFWPGPWEGPAGLANGLEALGRAARAVVIRSTRGERALAAADPAFARAAGALLRRLVLGKVFWEWTEIDAPSDLHETVRFEEVARIRLVWARTELGVREIAGSDAEVVETLARAAGRAPSPDLVAATWEADGGDAAGLRGAAFAVLLEERLRTRWGKLWFREDRSPRFLREVWEAEEGETAESVADALDLGTMEASLLSDGYRI